MGNELEDLRHLVRELRREIAQEQAITAQLRAAVEQQHQQILRYMECQTAILRALAAGMTPRGEP